MNMRLNMPVRELELVHGYYTEARMRALTEGQPIRHAPVAMPRPDSRPVITDWRTGSRISNCSVIGPGEHPAVRVSEDELRERFDSEAG